MVSDVLLLVNQLLILLARSSFDAGRFRDSLQGFLLALAEKLRVGFRGPDVSQDPLGFVPAVAALTKDSIEVLHGHLAPLRVLFSKDGELLMVIVWGSMAFLPFLLVSAESQVMGGHQIDGGVVDF